MSTVLTRRYKENQPGLNAVSAFFRTILRQFLLLKEPVFVLERQRCGSSEACVRRTYPTIADGRQGKTEMDAVIKSRATHHNNYHFSCNMPGNKLAHKYLHTFKSCINLHKCLHLLV